MYIFQYLRHVLKLLPFQGATVPTRDTQGVASLALGWVLHWAFSPRLLNPKVEFTNSANALNMACSCIKVCRSLPSVVMRYGCLSGSIALPCGVRTRISFCAFQLARAHAFYIS